MRVPKTRQIHIHHRVPVHHRKSVRQRVEARQNRARCAEGFLLDDVTDAQSPAAAVTKMLLNQIRAVKHKQKHVFEAMSASEFNLMFQERLGRAGNHGLPQIAKAILKPRALPAGEDAKLLHRTASATISSIARSTAAVDVSRGDQPSRCSFSIE